MPYALAKYVAYRYVAEHVIFLDLAADRYSCLLPAQARIFRQWVAGDARTDPVSLGLGSLIRAKLIDLRGEAGPLEPCDHPAPDRSLFDEVGTRAGTRATITAAVQLVVAARQAGRRSLLSLSLELARRVEPAESRRSAEAIVAAHRNLTTWTSGHRDCLLRSTAIARHLRSAGQSFTFVFGVKLGSFGAHCWIEQDGVILSDSYDHVAAFTPIAAL